MFLNKAFIIGNLTRDPELKALPSGTKLATFSVATNRNYKDKDGKRQEQAEFHNIVCFGKLGELCAQYLKKGAQAYVEGRIQTRSWEADGAKKYRTEIIAENVQFGSRGTGSGAGTSSSASASSPVPEGGIAKDPATGEAPSETIDYPQEEINPDDIPF
jgi:single-strand DNA-binding protein